MTARSCAAAGPDAEQPLRHGQAQARWLHFQHRAEICVRGIGPSRETAFEQAALALTAAVTPLQRVAPDARGRWLAQTVMDVFQRQPRAESCPR